MSPTRDQFQTCLLSTRHRHKYVSQTFPVYPSMDGKLHVYEQSIDLNATPYWKCYIGTMKRNTYISFRVNIVNLFFCCNELAQCKVVKCGVGENSDNYTTILHLWTSSEKTTFLKQ